MNLENTPLPNFLIADLYEHSLVIVDGEAKTEKTESQQVKSTPERQWYLGSNLQKITFITSEKEAVYLKEPSLQFLTSILGACKLNLGDVAIVNYHNEPVEYAFLKEKLAPAFLILFGITARQIKIPFTVPDYQVQKYENCTFLLTPPLEKMLGNSQEAKLEKSKLWLCLKKMFVI